MGMSHSNGDQLLHKRQLLTQATRDRGRAIVHHGQRWVPGSHDRRQLTLVSLVYLRPINCSRSGPSHAMQEPRSLLKPLHKHGSAGSSDGARKTAGCSMSRYVVATTFFYVYRYLTSRLNSYATEEGGSPEIV